MCELEYIGQLGSDPYFHIWTCHTHPHNFFSNSETLEQCPKFARQIKQADADKIKRDRALPASVDNSLSIEDFLG
jgi:hypothetical protein